MLKMYEENTAEMLDVLNKDLRKVLAPNKIIL